jgi:NAD+ kinase
LPALDAHDNSTSAVAEKFPISTVGLVVRLDHSPPAVALGLNLCNWIKAQGLAAIADPATASLIGASPAPPGEFTQRADLIVVLGGDGTLLGVARHIGERESPILGINMGGLGFLTEVTTEEALATLARVLAGDYEVDRRILLEAEVDRSEGRGGAVSECFRALNDVVIVKGTTGRMLELNVVADRTPFCSYRADGLIIATPTGSTAYALSAGGPIVYPNLGVLVLAPICPHTLSVRPVVLPDSFHLEIRVKTGDNEAILTCDGQETASFGITDVIRIRRCRHAVALIRSTHPYFEIWRNKLHWG